MCLWAGIYQSVCDASVRWGVTNRNRNYIVTLTFEHHVTTRRTDVRNLECSQPQHSDAYARFRDTNARV